MLDHWIKECMNEGRRVGVVVGGVAAQVNPAECVPQLRPAEILGLAKDSATHWWLDVELVPGETMAQMYAAEEILGLWPIAFGDES